MYIPMCKDCPYTKERVNQKARRGAGGGGEGGGVSKPSNTAIGFNTPHGAHEYSSNQIKSIFIIHNYPMHKKIKFVFDK